MLGSVVYWLAVGLVSLALVVALVLLLEARDDSEVEGARGGPDGAPVAARSLAPDGMGRATPG